VELPLSVVVVLRPDLQGVGLQRHCKEHHCLAQHCCWPH
jgi:hypothetical protein